jgi:membrane fusion protein (multidrug efflux system)
VVLVLVAGALIPRLLRSGGDAARAGAPPPDAGDTRLAVEVVRLEPRQLVEQLSSTGTVRADEEIQLVSEIAGKVVAIDFREGSRVRAGDLLVKIDDTELLAERDRAAYRVELAERAEDRQRRLLEEGLVSQQEYDFALNELNVLRAELKLTEAQLVKTEIRAPFSGLIGLRAVSLGAYLTPQTNIATLQKVDPVKIDFSIPERYTAHVGVGDVVRFRTRAGDRTHEGTVIAIEPRVDLDTRSLTLRARCPNPNGELVPGAFADVDFAVRSIDDALAVPSRAVVPELGGKKLYVVEDGVASVRHVETGLRTADLLQVTSGVEPGDRVIVSAIQRLREGLPVEVLDEPGGSGGSAAP